MILPLCILLSCLLAVANCWFTDSLNNILPNQQMFVTKPQLAHEREQMLPGITQLGKDAMSDFYEKMDNLEEETTNAYEQFFDNFVSTQMTNLYIPSVAVAFVDLKNANNSFEKVYCNSYAGMCALGKYTDNEKNSETLFRIASISKSVTATALMILADEHKLNMSAPVAQYLNGRFDFAMTSSRSFDKSEITFTQLLTHTAGFDETIVGQIVQKDDFMPLVDYLERVQPRRLFPNGVVPSYSNYGFSVVGALIELISNRTYEEFVRERLFAPLGMDRSVISPRDPAFADEDYWSRTAPQVVPGPYIDQAGADLGNYIFQFVPAGQIMLTPNDMATYMRFHLRGAVTDDGKRLISPQNIALMHGKQFFKDSPLGIGFGLIHTYVKSEVSIEHDGDMPSASSRMMLLPNSQRAIFLSVGKGSMPTRDEMKAEFTERFGVGQFPQQTQGESVAVPRVPGNYRATRFPHYGCMSMIMKLSQGVLTFRSYASNVASLILPSGTVDYVRSGEFTGFTVDSQWQAYPFMEISKNEHSLGDSRVEKVNRDGDAQYLTVINPFFNVERVEGMNDGLLMLILVGVGVLCIMIAGCVMCCSLCVRARRSAPRTAIDGKSLLDDHVGDVPVPILADLPEREEKIENATHLCCVLILPVLMFVIFVVWIVSQITIAKTLPLGFPADAALLWLLPTLLTVLTIALIVTVIASCVKKWWHPYRRVALAIFTTGFCAIVALFVIEHQYEQCWR